MNSDARERCPTNCSVLTDTPAMPVSLDIATLACTPRLVATDACSTTLAVVDEEGALFVKERTGAHPAGLDTATASPVIKAALQPGARQKAYHYATKQAVLAIFACVCSRLA